MALLELFPYDLHTVNPSLIAAARDFWTQLPQISGGSPTARLLLVASTLDEKDILRGFLHHAPPESSLPPLVAAYRALFEEYIESETRTTRYTRLFLSYNSGAQSDETAARLLSSYGLRARPLSENVPLPFGQLTTQWNRGEDEFGRNWAVVRSQMQQSGQIHLTCLHSLLSLDFPLWLSLDIETLPKSAAISMLRRKATSARFEKSPDLEAKAVAQDVHDIANLLRSEIQHAGMALHHIRLNVLVGAASEHELRERLNIVRSASGLALESWEASIDTVQEMFSARPPSGVTGTLMTTRGLLAAAGSAMTYRRRTETEGVLLGTDIYQSPVVFYLFDRAFPSYNATVLGITGSGKTFFVQHLAFGHLMLGCWVIIVDPQGNIDWSFLGDDVCQTIRLGTQDSRLNVLDILYDELPQQIEHVLSILKLLEVYGEHAADTLARTVLDRQLTEMYEAVWDAPRHHAPTLHHLQNRLDALATVEPDSEIGQVAGMMSYRLSRYTQGSQAELFGHHSNVDFSLTHPVTVFDISALPSPEKEGNLRAALLSILVGNTSQGIRRLRKSEHPAKEAPIIWFIDEMGVLMRDPVIASNTSYEFKTARARLVSMVIADQDLHSLLGRQDEYGTRHGEPMLANSAVSLIFNQREGQRHMIDQHFPEIPSSLRDRIYQQGLGQCVLQLPNDTLPVTVRVGEFERVLFSSRLQDRQRRQQLIHQLRTQLGFDPTPSPNGATHG